MQQMQSLNEVRLIGFVHQVKKQGAALILTVLTTYCYKDTAGFPCIEDTWHTVKAYQDVEIHRGDTVSVLGRMRNDRYIGQDGTERPVTTIIAEKIEKVNLKDKEK